MARASALANLTICIFACSLLSFSAFGACRNSSISSSESIGVLSSELFKETGICVTVEGTGQSERIITNLRAIFAKVLPRNAATRINRFRFLYLMDHLKQRNMQGYFHEQSNAIVMTNDADLSEDEIQATIAHEIGHAILFSLVAPRELVHLAKREGGWDIQYKHEHYYDQGFMQRFRGQNMMSKTFPTTYSYKNVQEWFAENFAIYVVAKLRAKTPPSSALARYFETLLST